MSGIEAAISLDYNLDTTRVAFKKIEPQLSIDRACLVRNLQFAALEGNMRIATGAVLASTLIFAALPAEASFIQTAVETSLGVIITGAGSVDLDGLTSTGIISVGSSAIIAASGNLFFSGQTDSYAGLIGPGSFGTGQIEAASAQTGDSFGLFANAGILALPAGYVSGAPLSNSLTFAGATFASLGLVAGSYAYNFGTNGSADFVAFRVIAPPSVVAEPVTLSLVGFSFASVVALRRRRPG